LVAGHYVHWHAIADAEKSVVDDVPRIRNHPLVPRHIPIFGSIYDVTSRRLNEVTKASEAGHPS
jgi:carbonic anhydrase